MAEVMILKAEKRTAEGSAAARRLRRAGKIPAVVYGGSTHRAIQLDAHSFGLTIRRHGEHQVMDLEVDAEAAGKVLIKEIQHEPISGAIIHADLVEVSMTRIIHVKLPIHLSGDPVGVKTGGILDQILSEIEVACLPGDMVEQIPVDVSALDVGHHLSVADISLPFGITALTDGAIVVASVVLPGAEKSEATAAEATEGVAEKSTKAVNDKP